MEGVDREGLTEKVNLSKDVNEAGEPIMVGAFRVGVSCCVRAPEETLGGRQSG